MAEAFCEFIHMKSFNGHGNYCTRKVAILREIPRSSYFLCNLTNGSNGVSFVRAAIIFVSVRIDSFFFSIQESIFIF